MTFEPNSRRACYAEKRARFNYPASVAWAEREAEKEREYQTAWQAGSMWSELGEEIANIRTQAMTLTKQARGAARAGACDFPALVDTIREKVTMLRVDMQEKRELRKSLEDGDGGRFDLYFYAGDERLQAAFNEGAGERVFAN